MLIISLLIVIIILILVYESRLTILKEKTNKKEKCFLSKIEHQLKDKSDYEKKYKEMLDVNIKLNQELNDLILKKYV